MCSTQLECGSFNSRDHAEEAIRGYLSELVADIEFKTEKRIDGWTIWRCVSRRGQFVASVDCRQLNDVVLTVNIHPMRLVSLGVISDYRLYRQVANGLISRELQLLED